jgi:DNA-directed RNA polymerase subunit RPC12/RpoP
VIRITCQYCSQQFKIKARAIPQGVTRTRCKSCGHKISLKPETTAASSTVKKQTVGAQKAGILNIGCLYCGKKYSINAAKIPPGVNTTSGAGCPRHC